MTGCCTRPEAFLHGPGRARQPGRLLLNVVPSPPPRRFAFGKTPPPQAQDDAFSTPCFTQCPSRKRTFSDGGGGKAGDCPNIAVQRQ